MEKARETRSRTARAQSQKSRGSEIASALAESQTSGKRPKSRNFTKRRSLTIWRGCLIPVGIALLIACLATGGNILYRYYRATSYQPARCVIQDKQVEDVAPSNAHDSRVYYVPTFSYQVITSSGRNLDAYPEYAGPGSGPVQTRMATSDEAQAVLADYQVGQTYRCWYSSFGIQPEAVLIFQEYTSGDIIFTSLGTLVCGFMLLLIILLLILQLLYPGWRTKQLLKKGRVTTGIVGKRWIEFEVCTDPSQRIRVPYNGSQVKRGSQIMVAYDAQDPQKNFSVVGASKGIKGMEFLGWCAVLFLTAATVFVLFTLWSASIQF